MRSDREEIPEGFTKEDADKAEIAEAEVLKRRTTQRASAQAAATDCMIYWPEWRYQVCGAIRVKYDSLGGPNSFLLYPTSNEIRNPDNVGVRQTFNNGPIYWHPSAGAHPVVNHFFAAWQRNGWEGGKLGYPTSDEIVNPDNFGRRQNFQGGTVYWKANEAFYVTGAIRDKWNQLGPLPAERSFLGYPLSDEVVLPGGQGRMNRFENGVIYWAPTTGAHPVAGQILNQWAADNYEQGPFGYPIADERRVGGIGAEQEFQGGWISFPKRVSDTYCGEVCTDAVYDRYPELRNDVFTSAVPRLPDCDSIQGDGVYLCVGEEDEQQTQQRAPQEPQSRSAPPDAAIEPWCYDAAYQKWRVEPLYACAVFDDDPLHQPVLVEKNRGNKVVVGRFHLKYELESRIDAKTLNFTMRLRIIVESATGEAAGAKVKVIPQCTQTPCQVREPPASEGGVLNEGSKVLVEFKVKPSSDPSPLSTPIMQFDLDMSPAPGMRWSEKRDGGKQYPTIRCDNYTYLSGMGCVFAEATPALDYGPDMLVPEVGWHIQQAQQSGLPGATKENPLHRATTVQRDESARIACRGPLYPSPRPAGKQCDEYPFKSAVEGAQNGGGPRTHGDPCKLPLISPGSGPVGFSVCILSAQQNSSAGTAIELMFSRYRVRRETAESLRR
ncbi:hypothetical protein ACHIPZ_24925 [Antrihabitans sp. NCIMB 15449]|uniref:LGFP repeat-containing protein n=1 Tax=Antrihabitans spumae TaxID=3373370 RepID=A0ABW7JWU8_9NOCA